MFELVTAITIEPPRARGRAEVPRAPWLDDHFPGATVAPATLLLELAAQIAGPLVEHAGDGAAVLGLVRSAVFRAPVPVPAALAIDAELVRDRVVRVEIAGVMTAELGFGLVPRAEPAWAAREARVARWKAAW